MDEEKYISRKIPTSTEVYGLLKHSDFRKKEVEKNVLWVMHHARWS
jgi:hypothetical protein